MNIQRGNNTELKYEAKRGGKTFNPNHLRINIFENSKPCYQERKEESRTWEKGY